MIGDIGMRRVERCEPLVKNSEFGRRLGVDQASIGPRCGSALAIAAR